MVSLRLWPDSVARVDALARERAWSRAVALRQVVAAGLAVFEGSRVPVLPVSADPVGISGLRDIAAGRVSRPARSRQASPVWTGPVDADGSPMGEEPS